MAIRNFFIALLIVLVSAPAFAQRHEVGVQAGMANLVGDKGRDNYILQKPFREIGKYGLPAYFGIMYKRNFNPYQGLRFNLGYSNVQFSDIRSVDLHRYERGAEGVNTVYNADLQFEYNFFPINNVQRTSLLSPYIFGGIGAIMFSETSTSAVNVNEFTEQFAMSIPFGAGLKYKFSRTWSLFGEIKLRYTFTDNIDFSGTVMGNPNSNDWVNAVTLGLSYSFGRPPCYCEN